MTTSPRVRIAPSPTGDPHVGTAYVGLFNMALARSLGGRFVLRIEDTDQARSTRESEAAILESLRWVGLEWDEGPDVGGPHGPYRQSERTAIYQEHVDRLLADGAAYRCFCTPERLAEMREAQRAAGGASGYDRRCRGLDRDDAAARAAAGEACVVRLAMPTEGESHFVDGLRGAIRQPNSQMDDQVLLKSDGFPTYHLANVVDDHLMGITHVLRAEEWISSTPKHIQLYEAFGWAPPTFVHLSLLRNADRSKISKRKNPVSLTWYREAGFLPEALLNFLALMGFSLPDEQERFTVEELIAEFDLGRLKASGPVFDLAKLEWLNGHWMRALSHDDLQRRLQEFLFSPRFSHILPLLQPRLGRLDEFVETASFFYTMDAPFDPDTVAIKKWPSKDPDLDEAAATAGRLRDMLGALKDLLALVEAAPALEAEALEAAHRAYADEHGWKARDLFMIVRWAVTGRKATPPLFETMVALGPERVRHRLRAAVGAVRAALK